MENKEEKKVIKISEVIECLDKTMTRAEIAEHFGLSKKECAVLFQNSKLKYLKPRQKNIISFVLEDDTVENTESTEEVKTETAEVEESPEEDKIPNLYANVPSDTEEEDSKSSVEPTEEKKTWGKVTLD